MSIDWPLLRREAVAMTSRSYAPYSGVLVGAAGLDDDGRIVRGCNVENASLRAHALRRVRAGVRPRAVGRRAAGRAWPCVAATGAPLTPCGRCRQLL